MLKRWFALAFFGATCLSAAAQPRFPDAGFVFDDTSLPDIYITLSPDSLNAAIQNTHIDREYRATFTFNRNGVQETLENIGFRVRGNTSRDAQKKSWKISFNTYEKGRDWHGLEKLNLNGEHNDPSVIRAKLSWDLFRKMGVPASRANHVRVFINGAYFGLYINVENIDEEFVQSRFGNKNGNLFKCLYPADLTWRGDDPAAYQYFSGDRQPYELETNNTTNDYTDLRNLIRAINQTSDADFPVEIQKILNVDAFLKVLAMDVATGSWDDYWYLKNNFYLYHNTQTGLFEWIPYDYDNTFGIDFLGKDWGKRDLNTWGNSSEARPLVTRLLKVSDFKYRYQYYLRQILDRYFANSAMNPEIDRLFNMNRSAAEADTYRLLDWGWNVASFAQSYDTALTGHVKYGLKSYITTRYYSALTQLSNANIAPILRYATVSTPNPTASQSVTVKVQVEDDQTNPALSLVYQANGTTDAVLRMKDDGTNGDEIANDGWYTATLPALGTNGKAAWYIEADDGRLGVNVYPAGAPKNRANLTVVQTDLVINEFMADNGGIIADPAGEFEDWIELYYLGNRSIALKNKYLSDDPSRPDKWPLPDVTLDATKPHLLIWADEDGAQGNDHANFKLSKGGEYIGLYELQGSNWVTLDALNFGAQTTNIAYGRFPDGGNVWQMMTRPTPGGPVSTTSESEQPDSFSAQFFPNPFQQRLTVNALLPQTGRLEWRVYDLTGRMIFTQDTFVPAGQQRLQWDGRDATGRPLASGVYLSVLTWQTAQGKQQRQSQTLVKTSH